MEIAIYIFGIILLLIGFIGCFIPILPGPPLSYVALLLLQLSEQPPFSLEFMITWALITIGVTALDYIVPVYGAKKFGGTKYGVWGSGIGLLLGIFLFPPLGIIIGPFLGAFIGELIAGSSNNSALKAAFGSFLGFLAGTIVKFVASVVMAFHFVKAIL
ncbi:MAG: DUF456 domain-containing protein [Cyclobacteriaceae bacterium]|nr:DUF456 domain-containing protein [Cyclobacteriaceae bacterium]